MIAVQTAYLKVHYTAEYMTALLSANAGKTEQVALYVADARSMGMPVLPPEINASFWDFAIEDIDDKPYIRFGLGAIKNVGQAAVELLLQERAASGKFADLNDFARRVDLRVGWQTGPGMSDQSGGDGWFWQSRRTAGIAGSHCCHQQQSLPRRRSGTNEFLRRDNRCDRNNHPA